VAGYLIGDVFRAKRGSTIALFVADHRNRIGAEEIADPDDGISA
jgi:hypothetical protein